MCISNRSLNQTYGKKSLIIKGGTIINPVTWWLEITKYEDKHAITISNLVETTWLTKYH